MITERGSAAIAICFVAAIVFRNRTLHMDGASVSADAVSGYAPSVQKTILLVSIFWMLIFDSEVFGDASGTL